MVTGYVVKSIKAYVYDFWFGKKIHKLEDLIVPVAMFFPDSPHVLSKCGIMFLVGELHVIADGPVRKEDDLISPLQAFPGALIVSPERQTPDEALAVWINLLKLVSTFPT
jgi:hypothetical protein